MTRLDRETREAIRDVVQKSMTEALLTYEEKWVTSEQLMQQFGMLSKDWMRRNAWRLPRGRFEFEDGAGKVVTRWAYPLHTIAKMITTDGIIK